VIYSGLTKYAIQGATNKKPPTISTVLLKNEECILWFGVIITNN
jgi:hypothetical protein